MAQMNLLTLFIFILAAGASSATLATPEPERFVPGRFVFVSPAASSVERRIERGMSEVDIEVRYGLNLNIVSYSWWAHYNLGTPATAQDYIKLLSSLGVTDFRLVEPPKQTQFEGYPAWTLTRAYTIKQRMNAGEIHIKESYLLIQRRWSYVVVEYKNDAEFYDQDSDKYRTFLDGFKLLPEPPGAPWLLAVLAVALLLMAVAWVIRRRRRRAPAA